jgi:hypothetical protein
MRLKSHTYYTFTERMKKAYLVICSIACAVLFGHLAFWAVVGGAGAVGFMLGTLFIGGISLLFWFPASLVAFVVALKLPRKKEKLKNVLLTFPAITLFLMYTAGKYYGP